MTDGLQLSLTGFNGELNRVRCFNHVLNLVVKVCHHYSSNYLATDRNISQAILSQFTQEKKKKKTAPAESDNPSDNEDSDDEDGIDADDTEFSELLKEIEQDDIEDDSAADYAEDVDAGREAADDIDIRKVGRAVQKDMQLTSADTNLGRFSLTKVRCCHCNPSL